MRQFRPARFPAHSTSVVRLRCTVNPNSNQAATRPTIARAARRDRGLLLVHDNPFERSLDLGRKVGLYEARQHEAYRLVAQQRHASVKPAAAKHERVARGR